MTTFDQVLRSLDDLERAPQRLIAAGRYYKNERAANETLAEIRRRDSDGFIVQADVSRPEEIKEMFRKVQTQFKKLDVFVSNARPEVPAFFQPPLQIYADGGASLMNPGVPPRDATGIGRRSCARNHFRAVTTIAWAGKLIRSSGK